MLDRKVFLERGHPSLVGLCSPSPFAEPAPSANCADNPRVSANDHRADFSSCSKVMCLSSSKLAVFKCPTGRLA